MIPRLLLLPDFIGHPLCFSALRAALAGAAECATPSYAELWPYDDVVDLARRVEAWLKGRPLDGILGYSFGGLVAFELALSLGAAGPFPPRVVLVDAHLCTLPSYLDGASVEEGIRAGLDERTRATVALLEELGEVDPRCLERNLASFTRYRPSGRLAAADLVTCGLDTATYKSATAWPEHVDALALHEVATSHADVLKDHRALALIKRLVTGETDGYPP
jgi:hypothetical protein